MTPINESVVLHNEMMQEIEAKTCVHVTNIKFLQSLKDLSREMGTKGEYGVLDRLIISEKESNAPVP